MIEICLCILTFCPIIVITISTIFFNTNNNIYEIFRKEYQLFIIDKLVYENFSTVTTHSQLKERRKKSSYRKIGYGGHPDKYLFSFPLDKEILNTPTIGNDLIDLLIFIHTRPEEFYERLLSRKSRYKSDNIKIIYITSKSKNKEINYKLNFESFLYEDILQFNEISSYFNLSIQTSHMILWCNKFVNFKYMLKTDIDVFVNIPLTLNLINKLNIVYNNYAIGRISKAYVLRNKKYSHYIPREIIKESMFPPYLQGVGYIIPYKTIKIISTTIEYVKPKIWIEDVFMGYLLKQNNISLIDFSNYILRDLPENISYILEHINRYILIHGFYPIEIYYLNLNYSKNA